MQRLPVSTVLLVRNCRDSLPRYLESMEMIDDIVVLDGGSTDGTIELLEQAPNCRIFPQDPQFLDEDGRIIDFSGMRNYGYSLLKHPWILCIDADEVATPQLLSETRRIVEEGKPGIFFVERTFTFNGAPVVVWGGSTFDHIRLFHRSCVRGCVKPVHERLDIIEGSYRGFLHAQVTVPLLPATRMRAKYDRYLAIEMNYRKHITFFDWFRWILVRNIFSILRRFVVIFAVRLLPKKGPRYPLSLEWEQIRYSILLTIRTCPLDFL